MSTLKADLKAWEASFRAANNGRDPTKADIKLVPDIGALAGRSCALETDPS